MPAGETEKKPTVSYNKIKFMLNINPFWIEYSLLSFFFLHRSVNLVKKSVVVVQILRKYVMNAWLWMVKRNVLLWLKHTKHVWEKKDLMFRCNKCDEILSAIFDLTCFNRLNNNLATKKSLVFLFSYYTCYRWIVLALTINSSISPNHRSIQISLNYLLQKKSTNRKYS